MRYTNKQCNNPKPKNDSEQSSDFSQIIEYALSRRAFLGHSITGLASFFMTNPTQAKKSATPSTLMGFTQVAANTTDTVTLPKGYRFKVLLSWGDPIFAAAPAFDPRANARAQEQQFGDNTDGMGFFPISDTRGVLAINNEYVNPEFLFDHHGKNMTAEDVKKSQAAHGVTIVELQRNRHGWHVDITGKYNRRITANTPMLATGPAAGHPLLHTKADNTGTQIQGTFSNCANGQTPWGTYLTCEENFHHYFGAANKRFVTKELKRYGIRPTDKRYQWSRFDPRFDFAKNPNEPNRHGWVVEIDPFDPNAIPKKRTALGRFKHENAALVVDNSGHVVVYLGDDERGEHLYKFVSKNKFLPNNTRANQDLLDDGTLYVAKFNAEAGALKGTGKWLALTHGQNGLSKENGFADQGQVLIHARLAATQLGATTMDRPEWVAVHPDKKTVYCTLTNNRSRGKKDTQPVGGPNPRAGNKYGQIVRWVPTEGDHTATTFDWDLYVIAGNPEVYKEGLNKGSANISADNMFNSPDGIGFDAAGRLWIQTDGKYSNTGDFAGMGNNQLLCSDPATGEIRRFMVGPVGCEVTGLAFSPDYTTLFVGIQHPGEKGSPSHFPDGGTNKPRSSVIAISRDDGGVVGA